MATMIDKQRFDTPSRPESFFSLFRIVREMRPYKRGIILIQTLGLGILGMGAALPFSLKYVATELQNGKLHVLLWVPPVAFIVAVLLAVTGAVRQLLSSKISFCLSRELQKKLYNHYLDMDVLYHLRVPTGEKMARVTFDTSWIVEGTTILLSDIIFMPLMMVVYGGLLLYTDWMLGLIALGLLPVVLWLSAPIGRKLRRISAALQHQNALISKHMAETFGGIMIVKAFRRERHEKSRFSELQDQFFSKAMLDALWQNALRPLARIATALFICLIGALAFYRLTVTKNLSVPNLIAFLGFIALFEGQLRKIGPAIRSMARAAASYERVDALISQRTASMSPEGTRQLDAFQARIEISGVGFAYDKKPVLRDISIEIPRGQLVAFSGLSGAGKTTLLRIIVGLLNPQSGSISIDGAPLPSLDLDSLRRLFSYVPQTGILFNASVRENILYGHPEATDEQIRHAAQLACADEFIRNMPTGYDTQVGELGEAISAGQRQRIAIARALVRDAPILVLDECFSNIDLLTEQRVYHNLSTLANSRTILIVTHRLATICRADYIYHLADGHVVEAGTHDELMQREGAYHSLYVMQSHLSRLRGGAGQPENAADAEG